MLLIVGLGNPGSDYARNRHNIGFMAVDELARRHGFGPWRQKFQAQVADGRLGGAKVLAMKPTTYMNESGRAIAEAVRFYKIDPHDILVIHDELDLPPGKSRLKTGGGHGGHNGLRSINQHIGTDYRRLRLGIGHPGSKDLVHRYVLHDFARADDAWIDPLIDAIAAHGDLLGSGEDQTFANRVHLATQPPKKDKPRAKPAPGSNPAGGTPKTGEKKPDATGGALADGLARLFGNRKD